MFHLSIFTFDKERVRLNFLIGEIEERWKNCSFHRMDRNFIFRAFVEENFHVLHLRGRLNFVIDAVSKNH